jgi:ankyrin repeat protein
LEDIDTARNLGIVDELIDMPNNAGYTPLNIAAMTGKPQIVKQLLRYKASVDKSDIGGRTPLINATINGHSDIVELLLDHGADINAKSNKNETALYRSVEEGWDEIMKWLLRSGAQIGQLSVNNYTVLHLAAQNNKQKLVAAFLPLLKGPVAKTIIDDASNDDHHTPLTCAIEHKGDLQMVQFLIVTGGADPSIKGREGKTPLEWAQTTGKMRLCV